MLSDVPKARGLCCLHNIKAVNDWANSQFYHYYCERRLEQSLCPVRYADERAYAFWSRLKWQRPKQLHLFRAAGGSSQ